MALFQVCLRTGRSVPISATSASFGAERVRRALLETAEYLEAIIDQAITGINAVHTALCSCPERILGVLTSLCNVALLHRPGRP